eukprot:scaffold2574_cov35-Prasinocladus_malaysianus.AAC.2
MADRFSVSCCMRIMLSCAGPSKEAGDGEAGPASHDRVEPKEDKNDVAEQLAAVQSQLSHLIKAETFYPKVFSGVAGRGCLAVLSWGPQRVHHLSASISPKTAAYSCAT